MAEEGYTNFVLQYWFIVIILGLGGIVLIIFNVVAYCYFAKRNPVDATKILPEIEEEEEARKRALQSPGFSNAFPNDGFRSPGGRSMLLEEDNNDLDQFRVDAYEAHNIYRENHGAGNLQYCESLSIYAQYWAESMAKSCKIAHSPPQWRAKYNGDPLGENVLVTNRFKVTGKGLSDMWYSESFKHDYYEETQADTKSFTQMVWNDSKQVGFGRAKGGNGNWYACAHYYPAGNIPNDFKNNVFQVVIQEEY
jgi:hypothetical protein